MIPLKTNSSLFPCSWVLIHQPKTPHHIHYRKGRKSKNPFPRESKAHTHKQKTTKNWDDQHINNEYIQYESYDLLKSMVSTSRKNRWLLRSAVRLPCEPFLLSWKHYFSYPFSLNQKVSFASEQKIFSRKAFFGKEREVKWETERLGWHLYTWRRIIRVWWKICSR